MNKKNTATIVAQLGSNDEPERRSPYTQLSLFEEPQPIHEYPLKIEPIPEALQGWYSEPRYWLIHWSGLRVPGTWNFKEAQVIQDLSKGWNWSIDPPSRIPACQSQILALCEAVCQRQIQRHQLAGGEA
jgi:hypothetical protein